jgi:hypothetical protein
MSFHHFPPETSSVTRFSVVTVKRGLVNPYMSPGVIVMMGDCMLYLGTKHVSYVLMLSLLDSQRSTRKI